MFPGFQVRVMFLGGETMLTRLNGLCRCQSLMKSVILFKGGNPVMEIRIILSMQFDCILDH
ncbi:hypothetical protein JHK86_045215 [Glycine max]|nr:hypothetical protein JHK86_045215 [Glycine max]